MYRFCDINMKVSNLEELITLRWRELEKRGVTTYQLAKEYGKLKGDHSNDKRYNRYVSTIEKAIANPTSVKVETLEWVKQAMGIETHYSIIERREVSLG
jgi:hypothetical protein